VLNSIYLFNNLFTPSYFFLTAIILSLYVNAQDDVYPTPAQKGTFYITNATIHVGNGAVVNNGTIKITDGKIVQVGTNISASGDVIDAKGKQVYPGLILPESDLGLKKSPMRFGVQTITRSWENGIPMCNQRWHTIPTLRSSIR